jgi:dihydroflavonol-4-reductase
MKVLVIGASGFLGANLVRALLAKGEQVRAMVRPSSRLQVLEGLDVERVQADLTDAGSLQRVCQEMQIVYQAASYYPSHTIAAKVAVAQSLTETRNLLDAVRRADVDRLIFTSTLTTIGFPPTGASRLANEEDPFVPMFPDNPYLMAKAAMEHEVMQAARNGLPAVVVNPTAFYGPYDSTPTSGRHILLIAKRLMPAYIEGPTNAVDVRDVADGMINAAERGRIGERYILGNWNTTQKELNALIARVAGVSPPLIRVPFPFAQHGSKLAEWLFRRILGRPAPVPAFFIEMLRHMQQYDCSKARRELGAPVRPPEQAIADALSWFRQNGYLRST